MNFKEMKERLNKLGYDVEMGEDGYYTRKHGTTNEKYYNTIELLEEELFNLED